MWPIPHPVKSDLVWRIIVGKGKREENFWGMSGNWLEVLTCNIQVKCLPSIEIEIVHLF